MSCIKGYSNVDLQNLASISMTGVWTSNQHKGLESFRGRGIHPPHPSKSKRQGEETQNNKAQGLGMFDQGQIWTKSAPVCWKLFHNAKEERTEGKKDCRSPRQQVTEFSHQDFLGQCNFSKTIHSQTQSVLPASVLIT